MSPTRIVDFLRNDAGKPLKAKELARGLGVPDDSFDEFRALLDSLTHEGLLVRLQRGRYAAPQKVNLVVGRLQSIRSGAGFVVPDDGGDDVFVPSNSLESAMDGDRVVARLESRAGEDRRARGSIVRVLERSRERVVGAYHRRRDHGFVSPEDRKLTRDFFVPPGKEGGAQDGDLVVLGITSWGDGRLGPAGEVERVLGSLEDPGVDILAIVYGHDLPLEFPKEVEEEAERLLRRGVAAEDLRGRRDLREQLVFTIDPPDARDHDDALSIRELGGGRWEVGIHIADVSHYVTEGGVLDKEAYLRGTSVYLVDRVVPMLPEPLSTDLCSLRVGEDRLALSLMVRVDEGGGFHGHELVRTVIRSRHSLSYEQAQEVLDGAASVDRETDDALRTLAGLARAMRARRRERGSIDFDVAESRVVLDESGAPVELSRVARIETNQLIEDFMLLANETLARAASEAERPFLYRVHEPPDADRIAQVRDLLATLGLHLPGDERPSPGRIQRLLDQVDGRPEEDLVSTVVLRSMKQARYAAEGLGHFGLAAEHYTHFTSPIRRYPDLVVHRLSVDAMIEGNRPPEELVESLPKIARHCSDRERLATGAERDSVDLKKVEFMQRHLGESFMGTISGVTGFGIFVLLDRFLVEGLVHISVLDDDYYEHVQEQFALIGKNTKRRFRMGDRLAVQVAAVNLEERKIDFVLADPDAFDS